MNESKTIQQLDTPSLLLDIDKLEANISEIASFAKKQGVSLRPHIKTHKSSEIARRQIESGAVGITVAKVSEAEVMVQGGIKDILIAYPLSSLKKLDRMSKLMSKVQVRLAVDSLEQANILQNFFQHSSQILEVWIKVNSGLNRCGVEPGKDAVELAKSIITLPNLKLNGIFTHAGHSYAASTPKEIEKIGIYEGTSVVESAELCEKSGIPIPVRSVGSTPTYRISGKIPGITEIRPGNAVFFDAVQVGLGVTKLEHCALSVLAGVVSIYGNDRLILDTGSKSLNLDKGAHGNDTVTGFGHVVGHPELTIKSLSEEHGISSISGGTSLKITDKVQIIPNHACTVVNLFDKIVIHRQGTIVGEWMIDARGKVQ